MLYKRKFISKLYLNNENLLFSNFQNKNTGELWVSGKSEDNIRVKDTSQIQILLKFRNNFVSNLLFSGLCNKNVIAKKLGFFLISTYNHGKTVWFRANLKATSCIGHHSAPECVQNSNTF